MLLPHYYIILKFIKRCDKKRNLLYSLLCRVSRF